jgi:hypothetical protein
MGTVLNCERDFLWKMVERDIAAYLKGGEDMELADWGRMLILRDPAEVEGVRACWAEARRVREENRKRKEEREGA